MSFERALQIRRLAAELPDEAIVLETDAPSIGLEGVPPEQAEPRHVLEVAQALAELRGETVETIARVTSGNAHALLGI